MTTQAEKKTEDWMTTKWRPLMAVTYMATIWFDFIVGPIIFNILQYWNPGQAITTWTPLTLQGGGLYHLAMGGILGIAAWTRGKEKVAAIENGKDESQGFNQGWGTAPEVSVPSQPQWIDQQHQKPEPSGYGNYQQEYEPQPVESDYTAPVAEEPEVREEPEAREEPEVREEPEARPVVNDPNRPVRRRRK